MHRDAALSGLGMAMRAGKLVTGEETVLKAVRQHKAKLVIVAADASANTRKKLQDKCASYAVPMIEAYDRLSLGAAIGKAERVLLAVTDPGFAAMIQRGLDRKPSHLSEVEGIDKKRQ